MYSNISNTIIITILIIIISIFNFCTLLNNKLSDQEGPSFFFFFNSILCVGVNLKYTHPLCGTQPKVICAVIVKVLFRSTYYRIVKKDAILARIKDLEHFYKRDTPSGLLQIKCQHRTVRQYLFEKYLSQVLGDITFFALREMAVPLN